MTLDDASQVLANLALPRTAEIAALIEARATIACDGYPSVSVEAGGKIVALVSEILADEGAKFDRTPSNMTYFEGARFYVSAIMVVGSDPRGWENVVKQIICRPAMAANERLTSLLRADAAGEA